MHNYCLCIISCFNSTTNMSQMGTAMSNKLPQLCKRNLFFYESSQMLCSWSKYSFFVRDNDLSLLTFARCSLSKKARGSNTCVFKLSVLKSSSNLSLCAGDENLGIGFGHFPSLLQSRNHAGLTGISHHASQEFKLQPIVASPTLKHYITIY